MINYILICKSLLILFFFLQAQRYLGVYYTDEEHEDQEKAITYFRLAANQNVCTFLS